MPKLTVTPYLRDFRSKDDALTAWRDGKDFVVEAGPFDHFWTSDGTPINRSQAEAEGAVVTIKYRRANAGNYRSTVIVPQES